MTSYQNLSAILLALSCLLLGSLADVPCAPVKTRECAGVTSRATLVGVYIKDCFDEPCAFRLGQNVTLEMDIEFRENVAKLEAELYAMIIPGGIPWTGIPRDACGNIVSDNDCPFKTGDYVTYGVDLYVQPTFPSVKTDVMVKLLDESKETQICWVVNAQVAQ